MMTVSYIGPLKGPKYHQIFINTNFELCSPISINIILHLHILYMLPKENVNLTLSINTIMNYNTPSAPKNNITKPR